VAAALSIDFWSRKTTGQRGGMAEAQLQRMLNRDELHPIGLEKNGMFI